MSLALKPYAAYKDSGVEWLGQVPEHWDVRKVREVARVVNGFPFDAARFSVSTGHQLIRIRDLNKQQTAIRYDGPLVDLVRVEPGEVLIGMDGDFNVGTWKGHEPALLNQRMCCVRSDDSRIERFLAFVFARPLKAINDVARSTTVKHLSSGQVERIAFAFPSLPEQAAIVRYLNHMDRRIRRYLRAKQKLIKLLEEQKQVIIQQAVTGQIDVRTGKPYPAYKDSGIEWLGQVPEHWDVRKLRSVFRQHGSGTTPPDDRYYGGGVPWVMTGDLSDNTVDTTKRTVTTEALAEVRALRMYPSGSLIVAMYGATIGKTGILTMNACTNQACCVLAEPKADTNPRYFQLVVNLGRIHLIEQSYGGGQPNINAEIVRSLRVPVPPRQEQDRIVAAIRRDEESQFIGRAQREISLLREYRTRLIADVVTGKLDVREAAANLPDEAEEPEPLAAEDLLTDESELNDAAQDEAAFEEVEV